MSGDLHPICVQGLAVNSWNTVRRIEEESAGDRIIDLYGEIVGTIEHPCQSARKDGISLYTRIGGK